MWKDTSGERGVELQLSKPKRKRGNEKNRKLAEFNAECGAERSAVRGGRQQMYDLFVCINFSRLIHTHICHFIEPKAHTLTHIHTYVWVKKYFSLFIFCATALFANWYRFASVLLKGVKSIAEPHTHTHTPHTYNWTCS